MQGYAFRCDQCKRTTFVAERPGSGHNQPPAEWFLVVQAQATPDVVWPTFHFCQFQCLFDFVHDAGTEQPLFTKDDLVGEHVDKSGGEQVLSEWDKERDDLTPFKDPVD